MTLLPVRQRPTGVADLRVERQFRCLLQVHHPISARVHKSEADLPYREIVKITCYLIHMFQAFRRNAGSTAI